MKRHHICKATPIFSIPNQKLERGPGETLREGRRGLQGGRKDSNAIGQRLVPELGLGQRFDFGVGAGGGGGGAVPGVEIGRRRRVQRRRIDTGQAVRVAALHLRRKLKKKFRPLSSPRLTLRNLNLIQFAFENKFPCCRPECNVKMFLSKPVKESRPYLVEKPIIKDVPRLMEHTSVFPLILENHFHFDFEEFHQSST